MASWSALLERRTGVQAIWKDHLETWSDSPVGRVAKVDRRKWAVWFFGVPTVGAAPFFFFHFNLNGIGQILAGTSVFTGLLFGLLGVIFNMGVTLRKEGDKFPNAHNLPVAIADLRANITYAIIVGFVLSVTLGIAAGVSTSAALAWGWTPAIVWLFIHLGLTLLMVLRRFRTAFNYITR
ncbi:hypothetical protein PDG61_21010 [Mycolicibacterium sp. BiH015]|uniref:hypothetical protein n=1 Tax=Mycolicibacterium sp. BiH015 TaxID=3018808 RepID=UPI0022E73F56|nr:hypothetical protein [Mycolicibacterium sp. BiH015]MDA2893408.1 hypothetical protein [Mycolicibacterium sp. BiH015]